jgi:hypothetical protein
VPAPPQSVRRSLRISGPEPMQWIGEHLLDIRLDGEQRPHICHSSRRVAFDSSAYARHELRWRSLGELSTVAAAMRSLQRGAGIVEPFLFGPLLQVRRPCKRLLEEALGPEASVLGGEEQLGSLRLRPLELRVDMPAKDDHDLRRDGDALAQARLRRLHVFVAERVRSPNEDDTLVPRDIGRRSGAAKRSRAHDAVLIRPASGVPGLTRSRRGRPVEHCAELCHDVA